MKLKKTLVKALSVLTISAMFYSCTSPVNESYRRVASIDAQKANDGFRLSSHGASEGFVELKQPVLVPKGAPKLRYFHNGRISDAISQREKEEGYCVLDIKEEQVDRVILGNQMIPYEWKGGHQQFSVLKLHDAKIARLYPRVLDSAKHRNDHIIRDDFKMTCFGEIVRYKHNGRLVYRRPTIGQFKKAFGGEHKVDVLIEH